jgi:hypothetical protein
MADIGELSTRVTIGVDFEPFEWKVAYFSPMDLELALNTYSKDGWDVFNVLRVDTDSAFQVILRKQIEKPEEGEF